MSKNSIKHKDFYFLVYLITSKEKISKSDVFQFASKEEPKNILTKIIKSPGEKVKLVKTFKYTCEPKEKIELEFSYDSNKYKAIIEPKDKTFIFNVNLQEIRLFEGFRQFFGISKTEQNALASHETMEYFIETLNKIQESDKIDILYQDSIKIYSKRPNFRFLINIFVHVYNTNLCSKLLEEFSKNLDKQEQIDNVLKNDLDQYKNYFNDICKSAEDLVSSNSLDKIDFYGLILSYLNNYFFERYTEKFNELYKNQKDILFAILLKYKLYFKNQIDLGLDILDEIIKFCIKYKNFNELKNNGLFYLKDINTFLYIIEKNKEEIVKTKEFKPFEPIEIPKFDLKNIDSIKLLENIESILKFSKEKNILLIYFKDYFWDGISKTCLENSFENIKTIYQFREKLKEYFKLVKELIEESENKIRKEIINFYIKGIFIRQLDERIKKYIDNNPRITNNEIINLIKNYNIYYHGDRYKEKRIPDILNKINLKTIDNEFRENFKAMEFEKIFENDLPNYIYVLLNKINKISDFDIIIDLINIDMLGNFKSRYLGNLNSKYKSIKKSDFSETNEKIITSLANLSYFMSVNQQNIDFLKKNINESPSISEKLRHKIYLRLINLCNINSQENIIKFISNIYLSSLNKNKNNLIEFIEFLMALTEEKSNDLIEKIDDQYYIIETDFYSKGENLHIRLMNNIMEKIKLKEDNKYIKNNNRVLEKISKEIENKEIKFEYLYNFASDKKQIVIEKLNILNKSGLEMSPDSAYDNIILNYNQMQQALNDLSLYKRALQQYHQKFKKEAISAMDKYIEIIGKGTYNTYYNIRLEIQILLNDLKEIVEKVNDVINSKIFKIFYQEKKNNKSEKNPFDEAYLEFKKFKESLAENRKDYVSKDSKNEFFSKIKKIISGSHPNNAIQNELYSLLEEGEKDDEEIMLILYSKNYEDDLKAMFYFLNKFENLTTEISKWIEKCMDNDKKELSEMKIKDPSEIKIILDELKEQELYDYKKEIKTAKKSNYIQIFNCFYENSQGLDFLYNNSTHDIQQLYDKIDPNNKTLSMKDIEAALNCVGFFQELKEKESLNEVIKEIKSKMENEDLFNCFKRFSENYRSIIELNQNFDSSINIYEDISEIINKAKFIFNKNNDEFKYRIIDENNEEKFEIIKIDKIRELKKKIQIKKEGKKLATDDSFKFNEKYEKFIFFRDLSNNIENIYDLMNALRTKGSTLPISIRMEIEYPSVKYFLGKDNENIEFTELIKFLSNAKSSIIKNFDSIYKQITTIRFFYGKQIDTILNHIQTNHKIDSFLRYILNLTDCKKEKEVKEGKKKINRTVDNFVKEYDRYNEDSFYIIHKYILSLFTENGLSFEDHYKKISIKKDSIKGLFSYLSQSNSMEEDILQIFLDKIGKIPIAQNILICNEDTSYEEMHAFFHRAILCKYNTLFVVKVSDSISDYQKRCINIFIDKLLTYKNEEYNKKKGKEIKKNNTYEYMDSCLVFIYNKDNEFFLNGLKNFKPQILEIKKENHAIKRSTNLDNASSNSSIMDPLREELPKNTHIIQSEICGLGKSTKIINLINKSQKKYIYFPLGGNISKDKIFFRLENIIKNLPNINNYEDIAIHLDLFETKNHSVLNEFLFSFLITKFYSNNENIIYIPINIEIYIEIPNCFNNFIENYKILTYFKGEDDIITFNNMPELELPKDKLILFDKMLDLKNEEEIFKWIEKIFKWIWSEENIKIPRYSFHQIKIFIDLFLSQYKKCGGQKLIFIRGNTIVTDEIIKSFAKGTKYFIYGGFSQLLLGNKYKVDSEKDDIDLLDDEYKNDLKNEKFDKKLIFIIEKEKTYYNLDISSTNLKDKEIVDYLDILKSILGLKSNIKYLKDILNENKYIITIDNFRKMILILYRIVANIPVILMGETGCGKTALIKILYRLLYNGKDELKIINIDPSYNNDKLTKEMKDVNKEAEKYKGKEFWVFFDELNTCDSMSLITEIFINRSFGGIKLNDKIRLIGACNPYRKKKKNSKSCGLTYPNKEKDNQLVYIVNILPQSLLYYVFNFGSLEKENEDQYILSIIADTFPDKELKEKTKNIISKCHEYLRNHFDPSVVSLREIKRFLKIYNFFIEYYKKKYECLGKAGNNESEKLKSIIISIYLCYYIRLVDEDSREGFNRYLLDSFKELVNYKFDKNVKHEENDLIYPGDLKDDLTNNYNISDFSQAAFSFSKILEQEEEFILKNIKLDPGIAKNKSLKENIFLLFTSLNTNIPLIIIGKPGSSKSLSAQLILKAMSGKYSKTKFFKLYKSIIQSYFQGSDSTTPENVEGIFKIAEDRLNDLRERDKKDDLPISMILFDELGLAEISKYNPLKVLHSHLELDGNQKGISFVGISNWTLDAAKINRALNLSVPDLEGKVDDLVLTSKSIVESINPYLKNKSIFDKILPNVYFNYKNNLKILKKLTVYKQYILQEYKNILYKYREDSELKNIFSDDKEYKECLSFFNKKEKKEKEENFEKIFSYEIFKKVSDKLKIFFDKEKIRLSINSEEFKKLYEKDRVIKEEFHGNRDYYYIIKGIANEMNENNNINLKEVIKRHIERNFGGLEIPIDFYRDYNECEEMEEFKKEHIKKFFEEITKEESKEAKKYRLPSDKIFKKIYNIYCEKNEKDFMFKEDDKDKEDADTYMNNIKDNINDSKSRFLLLEINPSLASLIYQKISKEIKNGPKKEAFFFEGSPFPNDNNNEYQFKIISQIQEHAENNHLIVLHNLEQIYAFLYDLFNKNFIIKDGKLYARICLDNFSDQYVHINEDFKIIIMANKKYLDKVEPPLLSRFEKMILSFDKLTNKNQRELADKIFEELDKTDITKLNYQVNYDLKNLLIGCRKEDILGMIYYENDINNKKNDDEIEGKIFNKIYKLLPQDIIVNMNLDNPLREAYKKKIYYNIQSYLSEEKILNKISIIYTFHSATEVINGIDESSSFKMISEIKSEIQLTNIINSIISEKANVEKNGKKVSLNKEKIFIHIDEANSKKIGFLISFINNNYDKNSELKFIFIVHLKRHFFLQQNQKNKLEKIYAIPDIYPDIYQTFIDNLNGPNITLQDILVDPIQKLLEENLINLKDEFHEALKQFLNENLRELYGKSDEINIDNYSEKLESYFESNNNLVENIIEKIKQFIKGEENGSNNIIEKIYNSQYVNKNSVDIISVIIEYIKKEIISKYIKQILCNLEDNNILTTLLAINNTSNLIDEDLINKIIEKYLYGIKIEENKYRPKFNLSYIIPGFYEFYPKLSDFITQNISNEFVKNERKLRNFLTGDKYETKQKYYKIEEDLISAIYIELENNKFIFEFIDKIPPDLLLNDYITFYIIKYLSEGDFKNILNYNNLSYNDCKHRLLNLLLDIRFDDNKKIVNLNKNEPFKLSIIKINWLESNHDNIIKILKIYNILGNIFEEDEFIKIIEKTLKNEKLKYITNERKNPDITTEVNECFYKILASICYSIIPPNINFKKVIGSINYLESVQNGMKIIRSLNNDLYLFSIEIDLIDELIRIYEVLELNDKLDNTILNEICMSLKKNNEILRASAEIQSEELIEEFKKLNELLKKVLNFNDIKYFELFKYIYYKEIKKIPNVKYRTAIFQEAIKEVEIIINSNDILQILLFPLVNPNKTKFHKSIIEILNSTDYDVASIIEFILGNQNDEIYVSLEETLLYYFEKNSLMYFSNIFKGKDKILLENDEEKPIYGPLKIFKESIKFLNNYKKGSDKIEKKNKNLCKLFCIGYIRAYCYTYYNLLDTCSTKLENDSKIISEINNSKALSKIISFYIWKIIYYKNKQNMDIFIDPEFIQKFKFSEYKSFKNVESYGNTFAYNYINPNVKDIYNKFNKALEQYKENNFENVKLEELTNEIDIDTFFFSTKNLISSNLKRNSYEKSETYKNFYKNVCTPFFKNKEKLFNAIKLLYEPQKFEKIRKKLEIHPDNLTIIFHSYRYFINELNSNNSNSIYSIFYNKNMSTKKIKENYYPGNDIEDIPIYSIYSKIKLHFKEIPNQGCFVCLCQRGGYYHSIKGGIPGEKYLDLKCCNCGEKIGSFKNERGFVKPIKRDNYFRIFKTKEESDNEKERNYDYYNCMSLDEFEKEYIFEKFKEGKGISKSDANFFKKDSKIVRFLTQISYRILNFILYSHLLFSQIYNSTDDLNIFLPKELTWIKLLSQSWEMIKIELNKLDITATAMFMNYIFYDLFSALNEHNSINEYDELIEFESKLDDLIQKKIQKFKEENKNIYRLNDYEPNDKFFFQNVLDERYKELNKDEYPFYNYFYYSDYINEEYLLNKLNFIGKDKYPVLFKVLENNKITDNKNKYSLEYLPLFNEVLNLFEEKYSYSMKRDRAKKLKLKDIKDEEIYINNRASIKNFIEFYNGLKLENESGKNLLQLSEENSELADFFIDDDNEIGKSYKFIYNQFIEKQNKEISDLLDNKIQKGIFERDCKNKISIQSANKNEIFITNLSEKFSIVEVVFTSSYRKVAKTKDYDTYNNIEVNLELIEDRMTELLLRNAKLFNNSISNFIYANETLEFKNKNIISLFNDLYETENIDLSDKLILYKFYQDNIENENLFRTIFDDFIQLILFLNYNKKLLKEETKNALIIKDKNKISDTFTTLGQKVSDDFKKLLNGQESLKISKTTFLFEYYRNLIFSRIKSQFKAFQVELEEDKKKVIEQILLEQKLITKEIFKSAIREFIALFLFLESEKEKNIKENKNNIINYLDIPDIWSKKVYTNRDFQKELNNLKRSNIKINQILSLYDYLGDDINEEYFKDVRRAKEKEEEIKKIEAKEEPQKDEEIQDDDDDNYERNSEDEGDDGRDYV